MLWIAERTFGLGTLRVGSGIGMGGKAMQSGSVKVVLTLGALISCIGAIYTFRVVADEVSYLYIILKLPVEAHSDVVSTSWLLPASTQDTPSLVSQDAIREVLGTSSIMAINGVSEGGR
ncbi:hypothetical protein [Pseudomonas abietaniphila]|nr:hypothetical protein [Pseudomonas abietaniphila]